MHTANADVRHLAQVGLAAFQHGAGRLKRALVKLFHRECAVERLVPGHELTAQIQLHLRAHAGGMELFGGGRVKHQSQRGILRIVFHQRFQHPHRIGCTASACVILHIGQNNRFIGALRVMHGFFSRFIGGIHLLGKTALIIHQ